MMMQKLIQLLSQSKKRCTCQTQQENPTQLSNLNEALMDNLPTSERYGYLEMCYDHLKSYAQTPMPVVLRVEFTTQGGSLSVDCFDDANHPLCGYYSSSDELPMWMQDSLLKLSMLNRKGNDSVSLENVGKRINHNIYWVFEEPDNGNDP